MKIKSISFLILTYLLNNVQSQEEIIEKLKESQTKYLKEDNWKKIDMEIQDFKNGLKDIFKFKIKLRKRKNIEFEKKIDQQKLTLLNNKTLEKILKIVDKKFIKSMNEIKQLVSQKYPNFQLKESDFKQYFVDNILQQFNNVREIFEQKNNIINKTSFDIIQFCSFKNNKCQDKFIQQISKNVKQTVQKIQNDNFLDKKMQNLNEQIEIQTYINTLNKLDLHNDEQQKIQDIISYLEKQTQKIKIYQIKNQKQKFQPLFKLQVF